MQKGKERLITELVEDGFLRTGRVIEAFRKVRREDFVPEECRKRAYANMPLPIGEGQTISQPLTVAAMTEALDVREGHKVLEVGAGSGYQAAILAELAGKSGKIITTERLRQLFGSAKKRLAGYSNVMILNIDGSGGYEKEAPYDRIIVTASAPKIPETLVKQLRKGGRMVIPVKDEMLLVEKNETVKTSFLGYYAFVPMIGEEGYEE